MVFPGSVGNVLPPDIFTGYKTPSDENFDRDGHDDDDKDDFFSAFDSFVL